MYTRTCPASVLPPLLNRATIATTAPFEGNARQNHPDSHRPCRCRLEPIALVPKWEQGLWARDLEERVLDWALVQGSLLRCRVWRWNRRWCWWRNSIGDGIGNIEGNSRCRQLAERKCSHQGLTSPAAHHQPHTKHDANRS